MPIFRKHGKEGKHGSVKYEKYTFYWMNVNIIIPEFMLNQDWRNIIFSPFPLNVISNLTKTRQ